MATAVFFYTLPRSSNLPQSHAPKVGPLIPSSQTPLLNLRHSLYWRLCLCFDFPSLWEFVWFLFYWFLFFTSFLAFAFVYLGRAGCRIPPPTARTPHVFADDCRIRSCGEEKPAAATIHSGRMQLALWQQDFGEGCWSGQGQWSYTLNNPTAVVGLNAAGWII